MEFNVDIFKTENYVLNTDFEVAINNLKEPMKNLKLDSDAERKKLLSKAKETQQNKIVKFENDDNRYEALKKYGEVLALVEKLFGLLPCDTENLSVEELTKKLEELIKSRKKNEQQLIFIFYQNLFTTCLNNLLTIEKDYQEGRLTTQDALTSVKSIKQEIKNQENDIPKILQPTHDEVDYLIKLYENSFSENFTENSKNRTPLKSGDLELSHKLMFENLNKKTSEMLSQVNDLSASLYKFQPVVNLENLTKKLKDTESLLENDNWDAKELNENLSSLEKTTRNLTSEQTLKNEQSKKMSDEIKTINETSNEFSKISFKEVSKETFVEAAKRAEQAIGITAEATELIDSDTAMPTTIGSQVANTIIAQMEADEDFIAKVATDPNADTAFKDKEKTEEAIESAEELQNHVLSVEEQKEILLKLQQENGTEPNDDKKE